LKKPLSALTVNEGVFSWWKGHNPFQVAPAFLSGVTSPMTETMSVWVFRSSMKDWGNRLTL
jgi:hypothetical protein